MPAIFALVAALLAAAPGPARLTLAGPPGPGRWAHVTPFAVGQTGKLFTLGEKETSVVLHGVAPGLAMVCAGGEKAATRCERMLIEDGAPLSMAGPVPGVKVTGGLRAGRTPLAGAQIGFVPYPLNLRKPFGVPLSREGKNLVWRVQTDAQGRFAAPLLAPGQYELDIKTKSGRLDRSEPFTVPAPEKLRRRQDPPDSVPVLDVGERSLAEGVELAVTVADALGQPIAAAGIGAGQETVPGRTAFFEARSDASGAAHLAPLDPSLPLAVRCQANGYVSSEQRFDTPPPEVRCVLSRLSGIEGKVVDEDGKPVSLATVTARTAEAAARTGADGNFFLEGLTAGEHRLVVAASGYKAAERKVTLRVGERRKLDPIQLDVTDSLAGKVVDGITHEAIAGAVVTVADPAGYDSATTDAAGSFSLPAGGEMNLRLDVAAEGYPVTTVEVAAERQAAAEPLRIELYPGGRVKATVWDEEADAPCLGCLVDLTSAEGKSLQLTTDRAGEALSPQLARGPYTAALETVLGGGSIVQVHGGDHLRYVTVEPGKTASVAFGERRPVLTVRFSPPPPAGWSLRADGGASSTTVAPGSDGSFVVHKRRGEALALTLGSPAGLSVRQATLPPDFADPTLDLPLPDGRVEGTLLRGKEPVPLSRVTLVAADGTEAARTTTDEAGAFLIPFLPPGVYELVSGTHPVQRFALPEGKTLDLGAVLAP